MGQDLAFVPLSKIRQNRVALRDVNRTSEDFIALTQSIRKDGVQVPIQVRRRKLEEDDKEYELVDGLQRFSASCEVGTGVIDGGQGKFIDVTGPDGKSQPVGVIPCYIVDKDEAEVLVSQTIANAHRIETRPIEYAKTLIKILGYNPTMTLSELAAKVSKSPAWVDKMMGLVTKLNDAIKPLVNEGRIKLINAYALATLPQEEQLLWTDRAQTMEGNEFGGKVKARLQEIKKANREGKDARPEQFIATRHLRKMSEITEQAEKADQLEALIRETGVTEGMAKSATGLVQAAVAGAKLALDWATNFDPKSQETQKQKDAERRKAAEESKIRREAEKTAKKQEEAIKKAEEAKEAARKAAEAAKGLPPVAEPATANA